MMSVHVHQMPLQLVGLPEQLGARRTSVFRRSAEEVCSNVSVSHLLAGQLEPALRACRSACGGACGAADDSGSIQVGLEVGAEGLEVAEPRAALAAEEGGWGAGAWKDEIC